MMVRREVNIATSNSDAGQVFSTKRLRTKRASPALPPTTTRLHIDQQLQQEQHQQSAETSKVEADVLNEASNCVNCAVLSPSRFSSSDVVRATATPVIASNTAGNAAATALLQAKRQRARNNRAAAPRGRRSATGPSSDSDGRSANTPPLVAVAVQHAVVSRKINRAKKTVYRSQRVFPNEIFLKCAVAGRAALQQDLVNRRFQYPLPFIGAMSCDFIGKAIGNDFHEIFSTDFVNFKWSYICAPRPGIQIKGCTVSCHLVKTLALGDLPPRMTSVMIDAIVVAKIYEKLGPELCPFMKKYCDRKEVDVRECEILSIGFPKQLTQMPFIEDIVDATGTTSKWIQCARIGDTTQMICHPGPSDRYSANRVWYGARKLRMVDTKDKKEFMCESFKLRKRIAIRRDKSYPTNLDDVNFGAHRSIRLVIAFATALAEFELAKYEKRNVSVNNAMKGFDLDPFTWKDSAGSNMVVVLWKSPGETHHLQTSNLRYLLGLITKTKEK